MIIASSSLLGNEWALGRVTGTGDVCVPVDPESVEGTPLEHYAQGMPCGQTSRIGEYWYLSVCDLTGFLL